MCQEQTFSAGLVSSAYLLFGLALIPIKKTIASARPTRSWPTKYDGNTSNVHLSMRRQKIAKHIAAPNLLGSDRPPALLKTPGFPA